MLTPEQKRKLRKYDKKLKEYVRVRNRGNGPKCPRCHQEGEGTGFTKVTTPPLEVWICDDCKVRYWKVVSKL